MQDITTVWPLLVKVADGEHCRFKYYVWFGFGVWELPWELRMDFDTYMEYLETEYDKEQRPQEVLQQTLGTRGKLHNLTS
jgi:hypothetical protein